jgi:hypothetical protein
VGRVEGMTVGCPDGFVGFKLRKYEISNIEK